MQHTYRSIRPHSLAVTCVCRSYLLPTDERQHFVAETDVQLKIFFLFSSSAFSLFQKLLVCYADQHRTGLPFCNSFRNARRC